MEAEGFGEKSYAIALETSLASYTHRLDFSLVLRYLVTIWSFLGKIKINDLFLIRLTIGTNIQKNKRSWSFMIMT